MTTTLTASAVPSRELSALEDLKNSLPSDSELGKALGKIADGLVAGNDVLVAKSDETLTPAQAAKLLGVSRTHFYKVLDAGALPFHVVGERDRRIRVADLLAYQDRVMLARSADAEAIAHRTELQDDVFDAM
jgi:excisionase family DNA binding protein